MSLEDYRYDIEMCLRCSSCKWIDPMWAKSKRFNKICPISSYYHFDSYSCQGLMDISLAILDGEIAFNKTVADIAYHCTLCGACDVMCKRTLDTERLPVIEELRKILAMKGLIPGKAIKRLSRATERSHNAFGAPEKKRFQWLDEDRRSGLTEGAKTAYFVGCSASYVSPEIARSTVDLLSAAGLEFRLMEAAEWCCGNPLLRGGLVEEAHRVMEHNLAAIRESGIERIVTSCAECYHMWKVDYPRQHDKKALDYEVLHSTEVLADRIKQDTFRWQKPIEMTVTYHDSCALGRLSEPHEPWAGKRLEYGKLDPPKHWRRGTNGVYSPPRKLLESIPGIKFVEMERVRENTFCCGAGGNVKWTFNEFAVATGVERIREAAETGAQVLTSTCPFCRQNLQEAVSQKNVDLEVLDVVEIAVRAL